MPEDSKTQAEEIVVRFKTTRPRGLLLSTSLENNPDRLQIYLEDGKAKMLIHIGDKEKVSRIFTNFPRNSPGKCVHHERRNSIALR